MYTRPADGDTVDVGDREEEVVRDAELLDDGLEVAVMLREIETDGEAVSDAVTDDETVEDSEVDAVTVAEVVIEAVVLDDTDGDDEALGLPDALAEEEVVVVTLVLDDTVNEHEILTDSVADIEAEIDTETEGETLDDELVLSVILEEGVTLPDSESDGEAL